MSDCPDTRTAWGGICETCGQRLPPAPGEWAGWRSERTDPEISARAKLSSTGSYYSKLKREQRPRGRAA